MMLYLYDLDNCRESHLDSDSVLVIEIENCRYLTSVVRALKSYSEVSPLALYDGDKRLNVEREAIVLINFFEEIELSKSIFTKLQEKLFQEDTLGYKVEFSKVAQQIDSLIKNIVGKSEIKFSWNAEAEPKDFMKLMEFGLAYSQDILENCLNFISTCGMMKLYKVVVFYNLKSLLKAESLTKLYRQCLYFRQSAVFVDSQHYEEKLDYEKKIYVDKDLFDMKL